MLSGGHGARAILPTRKSRTTRLCPPYILLRFDLVTADDIAPARDFGLYEGVRLLRGGACDLHAEGRHTLTHRGLLQCLAERGVEPRHCRIRRVRRYEHAG